ncbi:hypothetical protein AHIS1_p080 [Acaryochloris phage A-HIS1]|nr:hypothetical protein AHIS1_p080 [Acaryochloris phage A-HIS1]
MVHEVNMSENVGIEKHNGLITITLTEDAYEILQRIMAYGCSYIPISNRKENAIAKEVLDEILEEKYA